MKTKKFILYSFVAIVLTILAGLYVTGRINPYGVQTSFVHGLARIMDENRPPPPDIAIENVVLEKIANPTENFNFYRYSASVTIQNHGGAFRNAEVALGGDNQKNVFVKNTPKGLSLRNGQMFILKNYEVVFDGSYNGGEIELTLWMNDRKDYFEGNNSYKTEIFELPPTIESIGLEDISDDGTLILDFVFKNFVLNNGDFEIMTSDFAEFDDEQARYDEIHSRGRNYGYYRIKNTKAFVENDDWKSEKGSSLDSHYIKPGPDPFRAEKTTYAYIKIIDPDTGYFAVSNILQFVPQDGLNRAQFVKLFVDFTGETLFEDGEIYYEDVGLDAWYSPYVQTLYNLGLVNNTSNEFRPDEEISRGEALRVVMDYFDVDLRFKEEAPHFKDVNEDHYLYPYIEGLFADGVATVFNGHFSPDQTATEDYLKYLIHEYKENS